MTNLSKISWEDILLWPKSTLMAGQYAPLVLSVTVGAAAYVGFDMPGLESVGLGYVIGGGSVYVFNDFAIPPPNTTPSKSNPPAAQNLYTLDHQTSIEGTDINPGKYTGMTIPQLAKACDEEVQCVGFQSDGKLKSALNPGKWTPAIDFYEKR